MNFNVTYNGNAEVPDLVIDDQERDLDLHDEAITGFKLVRKHKKVSQVMTMAVHQSHLEGNPEDPSVSQFYQPIGKVVYVTAHAEGTLKKQYFFVYIATAEGSRVGGSNAVYICHVFKCRNEEDSHALLFAATQTRISNTKRRASVMTGSGSTEEAVLAWNAMNPPLYHFTVGKDNTVSGNCRVMCQVDKSIKAVTKVVRLTNRIKGDELILLLAEKFNLGSSNVNEFAVFDVRDNGDQNTLEDEDSPIDIALSWSDPSEGAFYLRKLPAGLVRLSKASIAPSEPLSQIGSDTQSQRDDRSVVTLGDAPGDSVVDDDDIESNLESPLGPQLPYNPADEDLLLSVMISKQTGSSLGFKLTPSYLLQMCIAYCSMQRTSTDLRSLLVKISKLVSASVKNNSKNPDLLLFWACNAMKLSTSLMKDSGVFSLYADCAKPLMDETVDYCLERITSCIEEGMDAPNDLKRASWNTTDELKTIVVDHYRTLDQNMSSESLREVVHRITAAMPTPTTDTSPPRSRASMSDVQSQHSQRSSQALISASPASAPMTSTPASGKSVPMDGLEQSEIQQNMTPVVRRNEPTKHETSNNDPQVDEHEYDPDDDEHADPLPEEWEELVDHETKHRFFANHLTRQTSWTDPRDKLVTVKLVKGGKGLGLGVAGAKKTKTGKLILGIFVSSLVPGSAAEVDGTLQEGDEILEVNGHSLIGVSREGAIEFLKQVPYGDTVTLLVSQQPGEQGISLRHTAL